MPIPQPHGLINPTTGAARIVTMAEAVRPIRVIEGFKFDATNALIVERLLT